MIASIITRLALRIERRLGLDKINDLQTHSSAVLLYIVLLFMSFMSGILTVVEFFKEARSLLPAVIFCLAVSLLLLSVVRRDAMMHVRGALPLLFFTLVTYMAWTGDRMFDEALLACSGLIALAGLLDGRRGIMTFSLLSLCLLLGIGWFHLGSVSPEFAGRATPSRLVNTLLFIAAGSGMVNLLVISLENNVHRLHREQVALAQANLELQNASASLKEQVTERTRHVEAALADVQSARQAAELQAWLSNGQVQLQLAARGVKDVTTLANHLMHRLCIDLGAQVGAFYIFSNERLHCVGGYAVPPSLPLQVEPGQGLVGQAFLRKQPIDLERTADELEIASGLGYIAARQGLVAPLFDQDGEVIGVLEFGALDPLHPDALRFIRYVERSIVTSVQVLQARRQLDELPTEVFRD